MYRVMTNWANYAPNLYSIDTYRDKNEFTFPTNGAVDMGTSVKWAACNLGALKPEEYGDYYAWGETQPKANYSWSTYKWCNGDNHKLTKYCPADKTDFWDGSGSPDGKTVLDPEDDAAHVNWGGTWRIPLEEEWIELIEGSVWEWTICEGINGYKVYDLGGGNSIFLPAAGYRDRILKKEGSEGVYRSSSLGPNDPSVSCGFYIDSGNGAHMGLNPHYFGFSIRPVCD